MASAGAGTVRSALISVDYEVFGKVQGVFFRKHTKKTADLCGLVGWVFNTENRTVTGTVQGKRDKVMSMKTWLKTKGSPKSRIDKCVFKNERDITKLEFNEFKIKK
ncbi:acylphosphatase-1-like [Lineus longissimus]|uniref:acylphosphatase-1-like n=1 Tax=Lineus longissimus TaxID=88925 RepID=UPI002B4D7310